MKLTIKRQPTASGGYLTGGEASIDPDAYKDAGHDELCAAIAEQIGQDAESIQLSGYNDEQETLYFAVR